MASKIPNPILDAIDKAMKSAGMTAAKTAAKTAKKTAKKAAAPRPVTAAKKATKKAAAPRAAAPTRSEKQIQNIMNHNNVDRKTAIEIAGLSRSERREFNANLHRAKTEAASAEKKANREATQAQNRIAHREKNEAKMNRYEKYKMENPTPQKRARKKKGAK